MKPRACFGLARVVDRISARVASGPGARAPWLILAALAGLPLAFMVWEFCHYVRNVPLWDEFESVIEFGLLLGDAQSRADWVELFLRQHNEHRMFTSRVIFAAMILLTGQVNFTVLAVIGNLFLVATVVLLVRTQSGHAARVAMLGCAGPLLWQLQHYESWFWAGSSIDHFQVIFLMATALWLATRPGRLAPAMAAVVAVLAVFTLAHGLAVWPAGAWLLAMQKRGRALAAWLGVGAVCTTVFLWGLDGVDRAAQTGAQGDGIRSAAWFWLTLLGAPPTFERAPVAPYAGVALLGAIAWLAVRGPWRQALFVSALLLAVLGAAGLIALGRAPMGVHPTTSRYLVVPCLAWALVLWLMIEQARTPSARWWRAATITVVLLVFATVSNIRHADRGAEFARRFDQGAAAYHRDGSVADAPRPLYPDPPQADAWLRAAEARGLYRMPARQPPGDNPD